MNKTEDRPQSKKLRLKNYDYSQNGAYFITICTVDRKCLFGEIVGCGILDAPEIRLTNIGENVLKTIEHFNSKSEFVSIERYVIMPNHIHLIIMLSNIGGASGKPHPTNALIPKTISSLKRFTNKLSGFSIWQTNYYEYIIRNEDEYIKTCEYIKNNPINWQNDKYFYN